MIRSENRFGIMRSLARRTPVAPGCRRLIGDAPVVSAIGCSGVGLAAAEEEVRLTGIADRPMALLLVEFEQRATLSERDDVLDQLRLRLQVIIVGRHVGERRVATHHRARRTKHGWRARLALAR